MRKAAQGNIFENISRGIALHQSYEPYYELTSVDFCIGALIASYQVPCTTDKLKRRNLISRKKARNTGWKYATPGTAKVANMLHYI